MKHSGFYMRESLLNSRLFVSKLEFIFTVQILLSSALYSLISLICIHLMNLRSLATYRSADSLIIGTKRC